MPGEPASHQPPSDAQRLRGRICGGQSEDENSRVCPSAPRASRDRTQALRVGSPPRCPACALSGSLACVVPRSDDVSGGQHETDRPSVVCSPRASGAARARPNNGRRLNAAQSKSPTRWGRVFRPPAAPATGCPRTKDPRTGRAGLSQKCGQQLFQLLLVAGGVVCALLSTFCFWREPSGVLLFRLSLPLLLTGLLWF